MGGIAERQQELRRRRKRREKYALLKRKVAKASTSEKTIIVGKIRKMTPGCDQVLENLGLVEKKSESKN